MLDLLPYVLPWHHLQSHCCYYLTSNCSDISLQHKHPFCTHRPELFSACNISLLSSSSVIWLSESPDGVVGFLPALKQLPSHTHSIMFLLLHNINFSHDHAAVVVLRSITVHLLVFVMWYSFWVIELTCCAGHDAGWPAVARSGMYLYVRNNDDFLSRIHDHLIEDVIW